MNPQDEARISEIKERLGDSKAPGKRQWVQTVAHYYHDDMDWLLALVEQQKQQLVQALEREARVRETIERLQELAEPCHECGANDFYVLVSALDDALNIEDASDRCVECEGVGYYEADEGDLDFSAHPTQRIRVWHDACKGTGRRERRRQHD